MENEYKLLKEKKHLGLPSVISKLKINGRTTLIMKKEEGLTPSELIKEYGYIPQEHIVWILERLLSLVGYLHSYRIVHGNIKPENIMIDSSGNVKLIDFDAARIFKTYQPQDTSFIGTAGFAAPEQYGINQTDCRSDIFALGILMNVMLTGEHPSKKLYDGKLGKVIETCINIDPNKRYSNVRELVSKL